MDDFTIPRCGHGHIILGCPEVDCPEQNAYLADLQTSLDRYETGQQEAAKEIVDAALRGHR
jgi:hypothetical protein